MTISRIQQLLPYAIPLSGIAISTYYASCQPPQHTSTHGVRLNEKRLTQTETFADQILNQYYPPSITPEQKKAYQKYQSTYNGAHIFAEADFRVRHGKLHAARSAIATEILVNFLKQQRYLPVLQMPQEITKALPFAALTHDVGRTDDLGAESSICKSSETSKEVCKQVLNQYGSYALSDPIKESIARASVGIQYEGSHILRDILQSADACEVKRADDWEFDEKYMFIFHKIKDNPIAVQELRQILKAWDEVLMTQGDKARSHAFNLSTKKTFEQDTQCYEKTRAIVEQNPTLRQYLNQPT
jgi:arsenate reductase-like glutaredoxin family protein